MFKSRIFCVLTLFVTTLSNAQETTAFQAGRSILGGGISFLVNDSNNNGIYGPNYVDDYRYYNWDGTHENSRINISPSYAVFIKDAISIGLKLNYSHTKSNSTYERDDRITTNSNLNNRFNFSVFLKEYFPLYKSFGATVEYAAGFGKIFGTNEYEIRYFSEDQENSSTIYEEDGHQYFGGITIGLYVTLNDHFLIDTSIGSLSYNHTKVDATDEGGQTVDSFSGSQGKLDFITQLSLDKLLRINYIF